KEPTTSQHDLFSKYDTFWKSDYEHLKGVADRAGVTFCSTPFDSESANFLAPLMPFIKISSSDITNKPFIKYLCQFSKPILLSTGAAYMWEIEEAVEWIQEEQNALVLLHCVLNYPTNEDHANLGAIQTLKQKFPECSIGYSDHTLPADMRTLEHAVLAGAQIVEKHFTHDKTLSGNDHYHAMDKKDLLQFRKNMKRAISLRGNGRLNNLRTQELSRANARRSLVLAKSIQAGAPLTPEHLTWKRPASGISPRHYDEILGRSVVLSLPADTILCWEHLGKRL
ncbi:MAG TPA: acetylneuraminic acid synthetase, partial [Bacteroidales bacterium]|nr:acetylneuraminic acid synthetase [Bacteroidales bacterium]